MTACVVCAHPHRAAGLDVCEACDAKSRLVRRRKGGNFDRGELSVDDDIAVTRGEWERAHADPPVHFVRGAAQ